MQVVSLKNVIIICGFSGVFFLGSFFSYAQQLNRITSLAGVYTGKTLFIQNPYDLNTSSFCIEDVFINTKKQKLNLSLSAIKLDFQEYDLNTPVTIKIVHTDTNCKPLIINPDAILFHTIFRFHSVSFSDTTLTWVTKGERGIGSFIVEKLNVTFNRWEEAAVVEAKGVYTNTPYTYFPKLQDGSNKYRIKYIFPGGSRNSHLYSKELEHEYYPKPVSFYPKSVKTILYFSRYTPFEIYNSKQELVHSGAGKQVDLRGKVRRGNYSIYFDDKDPGIFFKE